MGQNVYVAECDVGRGVFAARPFLPGERILSFRGHHVDHRDPIHFTSEGANLLQVGVQRYIYPQPRGLFVNHSCHPNAGLRGTVTLVALSYIAPGEEVRFDYSTSMDEKLWTMECRCGDANCRRVVRDFSELPSVLQQRYIEMNIVPRFIARQWSHILLSGGAGNGNGNGSGNGGVPEPIGTS